MRLLFVAPRFLFPADSGGKIRTGQVLRGMKGGPFDITLISPEPPGAAARHREDLEAVCDRFAGWPEPDRGALFPLTRMRHIPSSLPIPVATDRTPAGRDLVAAELAKQPDVAVFDFVHTAVLAPPSMAVPSVMFTHNVEAEIFRRHAENATNTVKRMVWKNQYDKMEAFEKSVLRRFDAVVAVAERDADYFRERHGLSNTAVIRTAVDLGFFAYASPASNEAVVLTASMDWFANIDAVTFLMDDVWPHVAAQVPQATMTVVGRNPPSSLVDRAREKGLPWTFTGFVDDVRPYVHDSAVYVMPIRVGGGTRIKTFEAMSMGVPVVSTTIGVEGLPLEPGTHYLRADSAEDFAAAILRLLADGDLRASLSRTARDYVEANFSADAAAREFEAICMAAAKGTPLPESSV